MLARMTNPFQAPGGRSVNWRRLAVDYNAWILIAGLSLVGSLLSPLFLTSANLTNVLQQSAFIGVLALGQYLVILTGGIDLSVGSLLALSTMVGALVMPQGSIVAVLASVGVCTALGALSGVIIVKGKLPPFIVTFGMLTIARGLDLSLTSGEAVNLPPDAGIAALGSGWSPVVVWIVAIAAIYLFLSQTRTGSYVYAIGGNAEAARVSGVNTGAILILVYAISGALAAVAGLVFLARAGVGLPTYGNGYELQTIAAVVVGGVNIMGGSGKLTGAVIGVVFMTMLGNILNLADANPFWSYCVIGAVLWMAVMFRSAIDRKRLERG